MSWVDEVMLRVEALSMPILGNAVCSHFGVSFGWCGKVVSLSDRSGVLLVAVYWRTRCSDRGFSDRTFRRWKHDIRALAPILDYWNGEPGNDGISMVLDFPTPQPFLQALQRYNKSGMAISRERFRCFDIAFEENLAQIRKQSEENFE